MRTLGSPVNWPPSPFDEVAGVLLTEMVRRSKPEATRGDELYTALQALAELDDWIAEAPGIKHPPSDRQSLASDLKAAMNMRGDEVRRATPACEALTRVVTELAHSDRLAGNAIARSTAAQARSQLGASQAASASLLDLVATVRRESAAAAAVQDRLGVLTAVLALRRCTTTPTLRVVSSILRDDRYEIQLARHLLHGEPQPNELMVNQDAGLSESERLDLATAYMRLDPVARHHAIWLFYRNARLEPANWRLTVGPIEFFDGPTMLLGIHDPGSVFPVTSDPLPSELLADESEGGLARHHFPDAGQIPFWVAARIDLGVGVFSDAPAFARLQAQAAIDIAVFRYRESTWRSMHGFVHIVDGRESSWSGPSGLPPFEERFAEFDNTGVELHDRAEIIARLTPISDPGTQRVAAAMSLFNQALRLPAIAQIPAMVQAAEVISKACETPSWKQFLLDNFATLWAYNSILDSIYDITQSAINDFDLAGTNVLPERDDLNRRITSHHSHGRVTIDIGAALEAIPLLRTRFPVHYAASRALRDINRNTESPTALRAWLDLLINEFKRNLERASRTRNTAVHGAADSGAAGTVSRFFAQVVQQCVQLAFRSVIDDSDIKATFDTNRTANRTWRRDMSNASSIRNALWPNAG